MSSFKSNENIHKKEDGSYYVVSATKASSVTYVKPVIFDTCEIVVMRFKSIPCDTDEWSFETKYTM